jgi:hypothetical protein
MANVRALAHLPWPIRMAVTLPVLAIMVWANYTAFSNKRAFEAFQEEERGGAHHARAQRVDRVAHRAPEAPRHDPDAYYPSEHRDQSNGHLGLWTAVAAGGTGLAVLAGGLGLFSLFGPANEPEEPEPELTDNPFV